MPITHIGLDLLCGQGSRPSIIADPFLYNNPSSSPHKSSIKINRRGILSGGCQRQFNRAPSTTSEATTGPDNKRTEQILELDREAQEAADTINNTTTARPNVATFFRIETRALSPALQAHPRLLRQRQAPRQERLALHLPPKSRNILDPLFTGNHHQSSVEMRLSPNNNTTTTRGQPRQGTT